MDDGSKIERLINQCKSSDVDVKVDALSKLQAEVESGADIHDPDGLLNVLKTCLRSSNNHLIAAIVSALPPVLPLLVSRSMGRPHPQNGAATSVSSSTSSTGPSTLIDIPMLRQILNAFLPSGGIIDRLGDKERIQLKVRESLVILGGFAFRCGVTSSMSVKTRDGRGVETPLMIFERCLKELGLASKVWKVREQSILTLVHIRRVHHLFPLRPYLSLLVGSLEDTDAHVRECARQSVVELFTGPAVTDAARTDLKKEMTKKGVRKTIVDAVLSKVLSGGGIGSNPTSEGSENGDIPAKKEYIPPSIALMNRKPSSSTNTMALQRTLSHSSVKDISRPSSRAAMNASPTPSPTSAETLEIQPVYIASSRDLENEFAGMQQAFDGKETEHNWAPRDRAIQRVRGMLKGDVHIRFTETFLGCLKEGFMQWSLKTLASLRTTVAINTCCLYSELATTIETALDPFCDMLLTHLLRMANFTKRITAQQSQASVTTILTKTPAHPRVVLPLLWNTLQEKNVQARSFAVSHFRTYLEVHARRSKHAIETSGGADILEKSMKKAISDPNPAVKESARACFWIFEGVWHDKGHAILKSLDNVARKQLEKTCPNPDTITNLPPETPVAKKSSVAAAIAASRAKAKAIATAPPTLRHQATSASHITPSRRAGSPSMSSRSTTARPASPLRISTSPPSPRSRIVSNGLSRSTNSSLISTLHSRESSGSGRTSPPSPLIEQLTFRRRASSPLASKTTSPNRYSIIRKGVQTALSASPPSSVGHTSPAPRSSDDHNVGSSSAPRQSTMLLDTNNEEESLLLATTIPIPEDDSSSEMETSVNLISFSTPFEVYPPPGMPTPKSDTQDQSLSPKSDDSPQLLGISTTLSTNSVDEVQLPTGHPVIEDALRARAEQAESAAERLLELVEPEEEGIEPPAIPSSLLVSNSGQSTPKVKPMKSSPIPIARGPPVTPINRNSIIMRQAALFRDSPARSDQQSSLMDVLNDRRHETGWWIKRMSLNGRGSVPKDMKPAQRLRQLEDLIMALTSVDVTVDVLQRLAVFCRQNPSAEAGSPLGSTLGSPVSPSPFISPPSSMPSLQLEIWDKDKSFERMFDAVVLVLDPQKDGDVLEYGLIVIWEIMENQGSYLEGREGEIFSLLLRLRYSNDPNVLEATNTIRDALTARIEPVYGLTTMHASLRAFYEDPYPVFSSAEIKSGTFAFGLIALGKFILRLPAEIAEEELPRLKGTLITALNDKTSLVVRESAAASVIAAQLVLRDETHLFMLLDGLADEKKNLLTYLFDKHGVRGMPTGTTNGAGAMSGMDRLEKEMRRLDTRTSTPPRAGPVKAE